MPLFSLPNVNTCHILQSSSSPHPLLPPACYPEGQKSTQANQHHHASIRQHKRINDNPRGIARPPNRSRRGETRRDAPSILRDSGIRNTRTIPFATRVLREILTGIPSILPVVRAILRVIVYVLCLLATLLRWYTWGPFDPPLDIRRERVVGK
jgi:hypothetical protein